MGNHRQRNGVERGVLDIPSSLGFCDSYDMIKRDVAAVEKMNTQNGIDTQTKTEALTEAEAGPR